MEEKVKARCKRFASAEGHVLKLLPTIFLQRMSEGCLDVEDAFLQVAQEKPLKVNLRGEECLVKKKPTGQRAGAKAWFDFFTEYLTEELNYKFSAECPCLG